jgi:PAS domain S-box-containing protein
VTGVVVNRSDGAREGLVRRAPDAIRLALRVLLVGVLCSLSTEIGFAHKVPPHNISVLWPTGAILFSVLVLTPVRHWWAYILAAYFTSLLHDARAGFPVSALLFVVAGVLEILIAAVGVRRFAGGPHAFESLSSLVAYLAVAVVLAPFVSAFVAAFAGAPEGYWFYWRVWFMSEALAFLTLAPAILAGILAVRTASAKPSYRRAAEACLVFGGLLAVGIRVFFYPAGTEASVPALVYLPLPLLLWAAVRFGPVGVNAALLGMAVLSISATVRGGGPFATGSPDENVLALQLFLMIVSLPLMFLAALIAERRARASMLRESEARFRSMADTAPVLIWMADPDRRRTYLSRNWLDFTGRVPAQELGNGWGAGIHPDDRERCLATYADAFEAGREFTMEYRLRRHDGEYRWVLDKAVPRRAADGTLLGYIGCADDISERKRAEAEAAQFRERLAHVVRVHTAGEMSAALAHEITQPLGAIENYALAARRRMSEAAPDLPHVAELLDKLVGQATRAGDVVTRMRGMVQRHELEPKEIDVERAVRDCVDMMRTDCEVRDIRIELEAADRLPKVVADEVHLQQVILNLLRNAMEAVEASRPGAVKRIAIEVGLDGKGAVSVKVTDSGPGIAESDLERVFESFYSTKPHGLGIGLAICRKLIEAHGGALWASHDPAGAVFQFTLPMAASTDSDRHG